MVNFPALYLLTNLGGTRTSSISKKIEDFYLKLNPPFNFKPKNYGLQDRLRIETLRTGHNLSKIKYTNGFKML